MILERLIKRSSRERRILGVALVAIVAVVGYLTAISPSLDVLNGVHNDLETGRENLELQQRQLSLLRAETAASQKILERLKDVPCPWIPAAQADDVLQDLQKEATDLGLMVHSVVRERAAGLRLKETKAPVSLLAVRLDMSGPYSSIMEMIRRLSKHSIAVGLEDLTMKGLDGPPYQVEVSILMRIPITEGGKHA